MDLPEARQYQILLFDLYGDLLTAKQREVFSMHYMDDHSLAEIGGFFGITPQAVADMLKRVSGRLARYEKSLAMAAKLETRQALAAEIRANLDALEGNPDGRTKIVLITQIRAFLGELAAL